MPVTRVTASQYRCSFCGAVELGFSKPNGWWARQVLINRFADSGKGEDDIIILPDGVEPIETRRYLFCPSCTERITNPDMHYFERPNMMNDPEMM